MRFVPTEPPRQFVVGVNASIRLKDCGRVGLDADEQITFVTEAGGEYDVVRKSWGFFATPSMNNRLPRFGLRAAMVRSDTGRYHVVLVEQGQEAAFEEYMRDERYVLLSWLSDQADLDRVERAAVMSSPRGMAP